ncbi:uncharacterized protein LOC133299210 [Gastrolobium bilobum]|uniref:uncharacterized protein LOC133299210 n=1 Tax=Gastrolobium bilobum TaxID=150636 RepID=UPI002AB09AC6|nr:uncharacterized protein LOC133299210 [Gastrolobium bilobum]
MDSQAQPRCLFNSPITDSDTETSTMVDASPMLPLSSNALDNTPTRDVIKKNTFNLQPVSPHASGEGLPYAPEGWPNPGDIWGWKVGKRASRSGYYHDRYLYLPISLQKSHKGLRFQSKPDLIRYLESNFPNLELEAFFASFSWQVPSTELSPTKAVPSSFIPLPGKSLETGQDATEEIAIQGKLKRKAQLSNQPSRKSSRLFHVRPRLPSVVQDANDVIDLCSLNQEASIESTEDLKSSSGFNLDQPASNQNGQTENNLVAVCNLVDSKDASGMQTAAQKSPNVTITENFDEYLNTLEDILVLPHNDTLSSDPVVPAITLENEMSERRKKLSSILAVDFPSLVSSNNLVEIATLASQLSKDPSLSIDQLIKLKLVEDIPLAGEALQEARRTIEEAEKFFADLEAKKHKVSSLKNEYNELKDKVAKLQAEIETSSSAIQEIDDQLLQLQSKRKEMSNAFETMQKKKVELTSSQTMLANSIPTIVGQIQLGHSQKPNWELKKANSAKRVAEIHERFSTLRGLTF